MLGAVNKPVLLAVLMIASALLAYRLVFQGGDGTPAGTPNAGGTAAAGAAGTRSRSAATGSSAAVAQVDPTLRLDLLKSSRAVNYTGSRRNIFVIGSIASSSTGAGKPGGTGKPGDPKVGEGAATKPPDTTPAPPPPVVIPLKFYGVAERSGGAVTKALLTSGETILIAQVGQTVAQHFKILRIGLTRLELEDVRDHTNHAIPLEEAAGAAAPAAGAKPE